uniref:USP domain-containing protein n=1 Tax=Plectus sambesii TaxID=2011161 RepID=A0A914WTS4_9BILA
CDHLASDAALDSSLTEIVRALLILKTHLDDFRKRYSYAIRKWELADPDMKSHQNIIAGSCSSANPPMHVYVQMSGDNQKMSFDVFKTDTLGQLRADVCDRLLASKAASGDHVGNAADVNGASEQRGIGDQAPQTLRLFFGGRELTMAWDMKSLSDLSIRDSVTFSAQLSSRYPALTPLADMPHRQQVSIAAPDQQASPIVQLLQPDHWNLLTDVIDRLFQCASTGDIEQRHRCYTFASRAWEIICLLPTNPDYKAKINTLLNRSTEDMESESESDVSWSDLLDSKRIHCLQYTLQIIDGMLFNPDVKQKFVQRGGLRHVMHVLLQKSLIPDKNEEWSQWLLDCLTCLLRTVIMSSVTQASDDERLPGRSRDRRSLGSPPESVSFIDISLLSISGNNLVAFLMDLIENLATERSIAAYNYANKAASVSFAFGLLTAVLTSSPELQSTQFLTYPSLSDWLRLVLVDTCPAYIRHESMLQLYRLCKMKLGNSLAAPGKPLVVPLLKTLLASLDHVQAVPLIPAVDDLSDKKGDRNASAKEMYGPSSVHYFQLVHGLLESLSAADVEKSLDLSALLCETTTYLESRPFFEHDDTTVDSGLRGLLILACDMIKVHKSWKTSEAATHLLSAAWDWAFAVPCNKNKSAPKCKHTESRLACFDLIIELCSGVDAHVAHVYLWLTQQHSKAVDDVYPWDYWPEDERRAPCGHVGLINLGATCYMATALQHLFMIPQCRVAILNFDPSKAQKHVGELVEMQKLFAFLNESKRKAYDPRELCKSYHMDGVVLNTAEQKDMTEFFTDCITKLEEMGPELRDMVRQLFCGVMVNSVVSESCSHVSKTTEEFYSVRCQVSDMKDLYASLDELTVADVLEGDNMYNCSQCNDKVKATKRTCFKHLPDILSFNTMRYSFNMLTMTKEKVNSHFSFPDRLSMSGYMERSLLPEHAAEDDDRQSTDYLLIGVTVHTGTADGGHYYSFIRDPHDDEKWYSFNDADVKLWDPANMALECFGGEMTRPMFDTTESRFMDLSFEKANSAYMVFYRRIPSPDDVAQLTTEVRQSSDLTDFIAKDNLRFVRDLMVFNHSYSQFVWQMCGEVPKSLTNNNYEEVMFQSAQLSLRFVLETLIHAKEKPMIQAWIDLLVKFLGGCPRAAEWFLDSMANDPKWPMEILIKCPIASCRQLFEKLVSQVIIQLHDKHQPLFCAPFSPGQNASEVDPRHVGQESSTTRFLAVLLSILSDKDLAVDMRQLTELFSLLATFAHQSAEASHFLILAGAPAICVRFYLRRANEELLDCSDEGDDDELTLLGLVRNSMLNRSLWVGPGLDKMCQLLCILLSRRLSLRKECTSMLLNGPGKGFPFLMQMCRDSSNVPIAANLIISVAELGRFQYGKQASKEQQAVPFFNILSQLCVQRPSGSVDTMDTYATLVAEQVWQCAEQKPVFFLQWLERAAPHSPVLLRSLTERLDLWVEKYLLKQVNSNGRQAAGSLLLSLVPSSMVRQRYSSFIGTHRESSRVESISTDAQHLLHTVYEHLLCLLENAVNYLPGAIHSQNRLVYYFSAMRACLVSNDEKKQLIPHLEHLWQVYEAGHDVTEKGDGNRQALLLFWHAAVVDCPEVAVATLALTNSDRASHLIA